MAEERHLDSLSEEGRYRLLVEAITDYAVYMLDREGHVSSWNRGAERFKGYTEAEILGQHFSRFYTEEDRAAGLPQRALQTAAAEGRFEAEGWRLRKDGTRFWTHVIIDAIRSDGGEVVAFAKVTRDVTERMQAQRALDDSREALFQTQKNEAIGKLTGGVAHDFNNLLMVITSSLGLLRKRIPAEDLQAHRLIENALSGAERGVTLTQRMLAFARKQDLDPKPTDLVALINGMSGILEHARDPVAQLSFALPPSLPAVLIDANQMETAILNLVVNASDAMPGGGEIVIGTTVVMLRENNSEGLAPGNYVCLSVSDNGEGMDAHTLAHAAEPFFTTKGVGKGTGLGLSMVQGLAEQWGGRLGIESRVGVGTTIRIWLPMADPAASVGEGAGRGSPQASGRHDLVVLAVDDDPLVLMGTEAMLMDLGHRVLVARSGEEALRMLAEERVDVVVTDHAMPRMTGMQLAGEVRLRYPDVAVILATGYAEMAPGQPFPLPKLAKPFTQEQLQAAIDAATGS